MAMREYLFSASILSTLAGGLGLLTKTLRSVQTWKTWLLWASWVISLVLAIAGVRSKRR